MAPRWPRWHHLSPTAQEQLVSIFLPCPSPRGPGFNREARGRLKNLKRDHVSPFLQSLQGSPLRPESSPTRPLQSGPPHGSDLTLLLSLAPVLRPLCSGRAQPWLRPSLFPARSLVWSPRPRPPLQCLKDSSNICPHNTRTRPISTSFASPPSPHAFSHVSDTRVLTAAVSPRGPWS